MDHEQLITASSYIIPLILAITMHEAAHGFVADKLGDSTARIMGRVSFDPFRHVELFGTILLPGFLILSGSPFVFGWAKPVPVNFSRLGNPRRDTILVALAGPLTNILLATISAFALHLDAFVSPESAPWTFMNIYNSVMVNIVLAVFNLLPVLPLDGGRILGALLPRDLARAYERTERWGIVIILLLFMLPSFLHDAGLMNINLGYYLIYLPSDFLRDVILNLAGIGTSAS